MKDENKPKVSAWASIMEEETGESIILLRASWAMAGFVGDAVYRYQQKGDYLTFRTYESLLDPMREFSRDHQFVVHRSTYDTNILHQMARIKRSVGDGVIKGSPRVERPEIIFGLSAEDATVYLRALCLCLKEKGDIAFDQSVGFRKMPERHCGEEAILLLVVDNETEERISNVPAIMLIVKEIDAGVQDFINDVPEASDYELED